MKKLKNFDKLVAHYTGLSVRVNKKMSYDKEEWDNLLLQIKEEVGSWELK